MKTIVTKIILLFLAAGVLTSAVVLPKIVQHDGVLPQPLARAGGEKREHAAGLSEELMSVARELETIWSWSQDTSETPPPRLGLGTFFRCLVAREFDQAEEEIARLESSGLSRESTTSLHRALEKARAEYEQLKLLMADREKREVGGGGAPPKELPPLPESLSVTFELGSSVVTPEARERITALKEVALSCEHFRLQVRGFADRAGSPQYNAILALARAEAVRDVLVEAGLDWNRISTVSFGESQASDRLERPNQAERRVEIIFQYADPVASAEASDRTATTATVLYE